ncbi:tRNA (adenosine(37)-N6)-threonylcarbamoyltransferase complex ATPase subunit type 1 TsaE [Primorskyibacter sp. S87]|uniref:tRNA (adenosine(37)-N6)-threonylcarbamoyltransferase complex ATPase subunit type 1 TsaE n=1 Tax=Primorskyibacter sp. S87 TaxID=3415126 RepID=UPI003C7C18C6
MTLHRATLSIRSPQAMAEFANRLGQLLRPGDCILLEGQIGAGKTHLARSLIQSLLDEPEDVPSPTFTLVQTYETRAGELWHADLYRLSSVTEIEELGLIEAFEEAICLVEWPDRLGNLAPEDALTISFTQGGDDPDTREISLRTNNPHWAIVLSKLAKKDAEMSRTP